MQTFTFYASDDKLENRGNAQRFTVSEGRSCCTGRESSNEPRPCSSCTRGFARFCLCCFRKDGFVSWSPGPQGAQINEEACNLAREVADEGGALVAGGVSQTPSYLSCKSESDVKAIFQKQLEVFVKKDVDFLIAEVCFLAASEIAHDEAKGMFCNHNQQNSSDHLSRNIKQKGFSWSIMMQC